MKKLVLPMAAAMATASIVVALLWKDLRRDRDGLEVLRAQVAELEGARTRVAAAAATRLAAPEVGASSVADDLAAPPAVPAAATAFETSKPIALASMSAEALRPKIAERYADLAGELDISPDQAEKFLDLIAEQQGKLSLLFQSQAGMSPEAARRMVYDRMRQDERGQAAMLGGKYPQWLMYEGKLAARSSIDELRNSLGAGEGALSDVQVIGLETALGAEIMQMNRDQQDYAMSPAAISAPSGEIVLRNLMERSRRLTIAATPHLTPPQRDRFRELLDKAVKRAREDEDRMERVRKIQARLEAGQ